MTASEKVVLKRELQKALSHVVRELRERLPHKPSQEQLADSIGMDRSYWGDLERGERSLTLFNLWRMALALSISPSRLVLAIDRRVHRGMTPPQTPTEQTLKRLRDAMDDSPEMKWLGDPGQKTIYCNRPLLSYLGLAPTDLEGVAWRQLIHPEDLKKQLALNNKAYVIRQAYVSRYRIRRADGSYDSIAQQVFPQFTAQGVFIGMLGTMIVIADGTR